MPAFRFPRFQAMGPEAQEKDKDKEKEKKKERERRKEREKPVREGTVRAWLDTDLVRIPVEDRFDESTRWIN